MSESRIKSASRSIVWGIINKVIAIILPFATRTVMIYVMGMEYVGLGSLFSSVLQVLSFAELGIGSALVFSMYKPMAENDDKKICQLLNFYRKTYRIIGSVIFGVGIIIMPFIKLLIKGDVPADINIYILFGIYLLNNVIGYFMYAYKQSLLTASQRVDIVSKIAMILQLISGIVQIVLMVTTKNYYMYAVILPLTTLFNNILVGFVTDKMFPQYKCTGDLDKHELNEIKLKVGGMVFQKIGGIVLSSVDTLVISSFLGLTQLALYQNYYYIFTALNGFFAVIQQAMIPSIGNEIALNDVKTNYKEFKKFNFIYVLIVSWCTVFLMCLYQPFMQLWVGTKNMFGIDMVLLFVAYFFVFKWCDMLYIYQDACGLWWDTRFVPFIASLVNLVVNIALVKLIGLPGILISTIVSIAFIYDIGYARVIFNTYFKRVRHGLSRFWRRQFFYFISTAIVVVITYFICSFIKLNSFLLTLIINAIICAVVPAICFIVFYCWLPEFKGALELVRRIIKR